MRLRYGRLAIASGAAVLLAGMTSIVPASAAQDHPWCNIALTTCILSNGNNEFVNLVSPPPDTSFTDVNGSTWGSRSVYEWKQDGTNSCMEDNSDTVEMATCSRGDSAQLWWNNNDRLVNKATSDCMQWGARDAYVYPCDGGSDQQWTG